RRYRPETFDEVIGQEHVTDPLKAAIERGRINHAYLFSGPRGCGKTTSARILARCLNCEQGPTPVPCGDCPSCRDLASGGPGSLDVVEIDAASHNGVDDARDLRERAIYAPARDRFKVFILDEAHMVTSQGFNALLKIVEEPPPHIKFVFATTEPEKVIGTIRSRTHHYPFRLVPPEALGNYLDDLCSRESVQVDKGVLPLVVRAGGGSVRESMTPRSRPGWASASAAERSLRSRSAPQRARGSSAASPGPTTSASVRPTAARSIACRPPSARSMPWPTTSGRSASTRSSTCCGARQRTMPAPVRAAPETVRTAAPGNWSLPAATATTPRVYLLASRSGRGSSCCTSASSRRSTDGAACRCGLRPMSTRWRAPARSAPPGSSSPALNAPKLTVASAASASGAARPVVASTKLGRSTAM